MTTEMTEEMTTETKEPPATKLPAMTVSAAPIPGAPVSLQPSIEEYENKVALWENSAEFAQLCTQIHAEYPTKSIVSRHIVDAIAQTIWRQRRIPSIEASLMAKSRADQISNPYQSNKPHLIADSVCNLQSVRGWFLRQEKAKYIEKEILALGSELLMSVLPAKADSKFDGGLAYSPEIAPNQSACDAALDRMEKIHPMLLAEWSESDGVTVKVSFINEPDGFLFPIWNSSARSLSAGDKERLSVAVNWTFSTKGANLLDLGAWLVEVAYKHFGSWLIAESKIGERETKRVENGLYFLEMSKELENLNRYEAHLQKHLLELISAYHVLLSKESRQ